MYDNNNKYQLLYKNIHFLCLTFKKNKNLADITSHSKDTTKVTCNISIEIQI